MTTRTVDQLADVAEQLAAVMQRETEVLRTMRPQENHGLHKHKETLAAAYRQLATKLREEPSQADGLGQATRSRLRHASQRLETASAQNAVALQAAMHANHRLGETIAAAVRNELGTNQTYGRDGRIGRPAKSARGAPISFNRSL